MIAGIDVWLLGVGAFLCTLAGGIVALRLGPNLRFVTGASAGAVVGLALFELIPEAAHLGSGTTGLAVVALAVAAGFSLYMLAQRTLAHAAGSLGANHLGAASLTLHSFFDGLGIGLAFRVSPKVGLAVAVAVLAHDLCDGVNTVTVALMGETPPDRRVARRWLAVNALAPLLGIALAGVAPVGAGMLAPLAAGFAGVFLYIGAAELLPRSLAGQRGLLAGLPAVSGAAAIYLLAVLTRTG